MTILAIESSCDDTAASVIRDGYVASSIVSSQLVHVGFGGVVPEIASRAHQRVIVPVVENALKAANCKIDEIDAVGVTYGPGLAGSLLVGLTFAKALALSLEVPIIGINHLEGHLFSVYADGNDPAKPLLSLIVSGGHTELVKTNSGLELTVLGRTRDDAAGEALDKFGKLIGLDFPGGPAVDKLALSGNRTFHDFPRSRLDGFDFSFSGIKTSILYHLNAFSENERASYIDTHRADLCASFQEAVVDMLCIQLEKAIDSDHFESISVVGGVSANSRLREQVELLCQSRGLDLYIPDPRYRTDNAAMIGIAAYHKLMAGHRDTLALTIDPAARLA